jgi:hypothetical protein
MNLPVFLALYLFQLVLTFPTFRSTCREKTLWSWTLYLVHHAFDIFLFWAPLFLSRRPEFMFHAVVVVLIGIHWLLYQNKCIATVVMNRVCGYPEGQWLDSLKNRLGLRAWNEYFHFIWIGALLIYDIIIVRQ